MTTDSTPDADGVDSLRRLVGMFDGADCLVVTDRMDECVTVSPGSTKDGTLWLGMGLITSHDAVKAAQAVGIAVYDGRTGLDA